MIELIWR